MPVGDENDRARFERLFGELFVESDRGCILTAASVLQDLLATLIKKKLTPNEHARKHAADLLFGGMAPLSTFSAQIKIAYCLGLISQWQFLDFELIRKLRNKALMNLPLSHSKIQQLFEQHASSRPQITLFRR
ncbi:MAG: hypothetical protein J0L73_02055 [Verrucomicrobia bacterium]|nr:hypothetical protein [Verrucomicrobiota bacterium]